MSEYDDDGQRLDDEDQDHSLGAFDVEVECLLCSVRYRAMATRHDPSYDSPGWVEPEPGEERCPECRE